MRTRKCSAVLNLPANPIRIAQDYGRITFLQIKEVDYLIRVQCGQLLCSPLGHFE
jgi:hypothetical protein